MKALLILFAAAVVIGTLHGAETIRMASEARVWLKVPAGQAPLGDIRVSSGSAAPAPWEKDPAVRERHIEVLFPVRWWSWSELIVSFTPAHIGSVEFSLLGPWAADKNGAMPRQEVLWDSVGAVGTVIENGSFLVTGEGGPAGWKSQWEAYPEAGVWPLARAGNGVAAAWCNRPLVQSFHVNAGRRVTLRFSAKAATPPDFVEPMALGRDTAAHRALARIKRGVNLGNGWETPPGNAWGVSFTTEDIDRIAAEGFDHIRVPVAWHYYLKPGGDGVDPALLGMLEPVLRRALEKNLHVILNWHHFHDFTKDPAGKLGSFVSGWETIGRHFESWPPGLWFELLNEPCDALTTEAVNPVYQKTIAAIRKSNPQRMLVAGPGRWNSVGELDKLRLPDADDRIIVTVHNYEPFQFTHQGAGWVGMEKLRGIIYPGPPATPLQVPESLLENAGVVSFIGRYNTLPADCNPCSKRTVGAALDAAREWSLRFGRPVHLGEFGANGAGDKASRGRYLHDVRTLAEQRGIPWTMWEWKAGFGYWDSETNQPGFRSSLFE